MAEDSRAGTTPGRSKDAPRRTPQRRTAREGVICYQTNKRHPHRLLAPIANASPKQQHVSLTRLPPRQPLSPHRPTMMRMYASSRKMGGASGPASAARLSEWRGYASCSGVVYDCRTAAQRCRGRPNEGPPKVHIIGCQSFPALHHPPHHPPGASRGVSPLVSMNPDRLPSFLLTPVTPSTHTPRDPLVPHHLRPPARPHTCITGYTARTSSEGGRPLQRWRRKAVRSGCCPSAKGASSGERSRAYTRRGSGARWGAWLKCRSTCARGVG
jgi:hypothetical protein